VTRVWPVLGTCVGAHPKGHPGHSAVAGGRVSEAVARAASRDPQKTPQIETDRSPPSRDLGNASHGGQADRHSTFEPLELVGGIGAGSSNLGASICAGAKSMPSRLGKKACPFPRCVANLKGCPVSNHITWQPHSQSRPRSVFPQQSVPSVQKANTACYLDCVVFLRATPFKSIRGRYRRPSNDKDILRCLAAITPEGCRSSGVRPPACEYKGAARAAQSAA
jgi:hypothetical protein